MEFSVKAYFQKEDSSVEVRRVPVALDDQGGIYDQLLNKVASSFPGLKEKYLTLKWRDSDGDYVLMSSDEEVMEALSQTSGSPLKIYITADADRGDTPANEEAENSFQEPNNHNKEDSEGDRNDFNSFFFISPPMPPPPPFNGQESPSGRRRRHHDQFGRHFNFGGHFPFRGQGSFSYGPFEGQPPCGGKPSDKPGCCGGPEPSGRSGFFRGPGPFGGPGHFGGPFGGPGPFGRHGGPFGKHGHFSHEHFGGFGHGPFGHFFHHEQEHGFKHGHRKRDHDEKGWKQQLRDAVPVPHRRWAKNYISYWRETNLKNATTTSSDSDQEQVRMETASVPLAYAKWLDYILPKWHKQWDQESSQEGSKSDDELGKNEENKKLKDSVPLEFRKWTKWYLARHFGKKEPPKFRDWFQQGQRHCHGKGNKHGGSAKKMWKKAYKMHFLRSSVPLKYRIWAREFICDWRQQNKIPDRAGLSSSSESEDAQRETSHGKIAVPNDYIQWLTLFLNKWHIKRGLLSGQKFNKAEIAAIKEAVPWDFRKWVKCYLWRRHCNASGDTCTASQYQQWLAAFQKKWLNETSDSDGANLVSSDEENTSATSGKTPDKEVEKSFKRLRLEEQNAAQKNVTFAEGDQGKDSTGDGDGEAGSLWDQKRKLNPGFWNWAKEALNQWDGKTVTSGSAMSDEEIPPHVYHWMSKMMMKMQMKKMKKDMKDARKEMKAAAKAHRYFKI